MDKPIRDKKPDDPNRHPGPKSGELADADLENITGGHQQVSRVIPQTPATPPGVPIPYPNLSSK